MLKKIQVSLKDLRDILYLNIFFRKYVEKIQVSLKDFHDILYLSIFFENMLKNSSLIKGFS